MTRRSQWRLGTRGAALAVAVVLAAGAAAACAPLKSGPRGPKVLMVGDSVASALAPYLGGAFAGRSFESVAQAGCGIIRGRTADWAGNEHEYGHACDAVMWGRQEEFLQRIDPDIVVWLGIVELLPRYVDGDLYTPGLPGPPFGYNGAAADLKILQLMNEQWGHFTSRGARLVILTMLPPTTSENQIDQRTIHLNDLLRQFAAQHPENTSVIDLGLLLCPSGLPCPAVFDGVVLRRPDTQIHYSPEGSAYVAAGIAQLILGEAP